MLHSNVIKCLKTLDWCSLERTLCHFDKGNLFLLNSNLYEGSSESHNSRRKGENPVTRGNFNLKGSGFAPNFWQRWTIMVPHCPLEEGARTTSPLRMLGLLNESWNYFQIISIAVDTCILLEICIALTYMNNGKRLNNEPMRRRRQEFLQMQCAPWWRRPGHASRVNRSYLWPQSACLHSATGHLRNSPRHHRPWPTDGEIEPSDWSPATDMIAVKL